MILDSLHPISVLLSRGDSSDSHDNHTEDLGDSLPPVPLVAAASPGSPVEIDDSLQRPTPLRSPLTWPAPPQSALPRSESIEGGAGAQPGHSPRPPRPQLRLWDFDPPPNSDSDSSGGGLGGSSVCSLRAHRVRFSVDTGKGLLHCNSAENLSATPGSQSVPATPPYPQAPSLPPPSGESPTAAAPVSHMWDSGKL